MVPETTTTAAFVPATAAVNWARLDTVVVVPPLPPVVPPLVLAKPTVAASVIEAATASAAGTGLAATRAAEAAAIIGVNFILIKDECFDEKAMSN